MKRMEELIHLNKKIHFEGKVTEVFSVGHVGQCWARVNVFINILFQCFLMQQHFSSLLQIFPLISQSRWLVKHGELLEVDTLTMSISGSKLKLPTKPVYLHLFNDCLLLSRRKE